MNLNNKLQCFKSAVSFSFCFSFTELQLKTVSKALRITMFKGLKHSGKAFSAEPVEMSTLGESMTSEAHPIASGVGG